LSPPGYWQISLPRIYAIADQLTRDGIPCPSAHDPGCNRHRSGQAWSKGAVRAILLNPGHVRRSGVRRRLRVTLGLVAIVPASPASNSARRARSGAASARGEHGPVVNPGRLSQQSGR